MYAQIHTINPFDAKNGTTIKFTWKGNQIFKIRCIIKENESGAIVYDNTIDSIKPTYTLPPDSGLVNGKYYLCYITIFDIDGKESDLQNIGTAFYCFSTPTFKLSVEDGDIIKGSVYEIILSYAQTESEELDNYSFFLYSYQKTLLQSSGIQYNTTPPLSYTLSNLVNATQYYIRATGTTIHGLQLDTGYILIHVSYTESQVWTSLYLNNRSDIGAIEINANIIAAEGVPEDPDKIKYIEPHFVDVTETHVKFDEGFDVSGNFSIIASFYKPKINSYILLWDTDTSTRLYVYYYEGIFSDSEGKQGYFELRNTPIISLGNLVNDDISYTIHSNYIDIPQDTQEYSLLINRINGLYDLKAVLIDKPLK